MRLIHILIIVSIFLLGFFTNIAYSSFSNNARTPFLGSSELISPHDWVKEDQIWATKNGIIINVKNAEISKYADTNSMDPLLDIGSNGIEIVPQNEEEVHIGDVIVYEPTWTEGLVIHRVIDIKKQGSKTYFITKGDNNKEADPSITFSQIRYILVGVIY